MSQHLSAYRKQLLAVGVLLSIASAAAADQPKVAEVPPVDVEGKLQWLYDYQKAKALARVSGRPMFVVFRCER